MSQIMTRVRPLTIEEDTLRDRLAQEFRNPAPGNIQPLFSIEKPGHGTHVLVIWDDWKDYSLRDRSRITLEAYEEAFGAEKILDISAALGLTTDEAKRLGYDF